MIGDQLAEAVLDGELELFEAKKLFALAVIGATLKQFDGNIAATARALGVKRTSLSEMIRTRMNLQKLIAKTKHKVRVEKKREYCPECRSVLTPNGCFGCAIIAECLDSVGTAFPLNR
jgi:hypothetical protein